MIDPAARLADEHKKLVMVQEVGRALSSGLALDPLLSLIMAKVTDLMDADRSTLYLLSDDREELWSKLVQVPTRNEPAEVRDPDPSTINIRLKVGEGIAGWVAQTGDIVNIADVYQDVRFDATVDKKSGYRTTSMLCVPMQDAAGQRVGVLQVLNKKAGAFVIADEELLLALASQAAVAIANARLVHSVLEQNKTLSKVRRDLERKTRELNAVYEIEKEVSASFHMDELLRRILAQTVSALGGGGGAIALRQPDSSLQFTTTQGPSATKLIGRELAGGAGILGWSVQHRTPVIVHDPSNDPRYAADLARFIGVVPKVVIVAPLIDGDDVVGGIEIIEQRGSARDLENPTGRRWSEDDLKMLELIAAQIARAIGLARQRNEVQTKDRLASIGQMMAGVLHDLKTPMTIISGYAQLMAGSDDGAQREQYVDMISKQFGLMSGMTKDVLAFSRGDADVVIRKVYLHRFLDDVQTQMQALVAGRNTVFQVESGFDGVAWFDDQKLLRVIHNLVRNAVEAMPTGGTVSLRIVETEDGVCWTIADNGPGIPLSMRSRLFELFATEKKGGTGLGLAIVKKIIDDHGGTIRCDTSGDGTSFHFRLPKRVE